MSMFKRTVLALFIALIMPPAAQAAEADPAVRKVQSFYATLVETMKRGPSLGMKGRYQALAPAVDATFDIPTMVKFIVGTNWSAMSDADHKALAEGFRRMTIANYASNFDAFHGEQFSVDPNVQSKNGDTFVQSNLTLQGNAKPIPFIYRMRDTDGNWKVIDIYLNGYVSELATRRSDFAATLSSGGAPALVKKLNSLADSQLGGTSSGE